MSAIARVANDLSNAQIHLQETRDMITEIVTVLDPIIPSVKVDSSGKYVLELTQDQHQALIQNLINLRHILR